MPRSLGLLPYTSFYVASAVSLRGLSQPRLRSNLSQSDGVVGLCNGSHHVMQSTSTALLWIVGSTSRALLLMIVFRLAYLFRREIVWVPRIKNEWNHCRNFEKISSAGVKSFYHEIERENILMMSSPMTAKAFPTRRTENKSRDEMRSDDG